ncbi:MAG: PrsW family intramembrane metalloprotease [Nocardioidaceae bacterium]
MSTATASEPTSNSRFRDWWTRDRTRERQRRAATVSLTVASIVIGGWCAWLLHADVDQALGQRAFLYAFLFAFLPVIPLVTLLVWCGRLRPPPARFICLALGWGALVATLISLRLNGWLAIQIGDQYGATPRSAVFIAPWVEETAKGAALFALVWWNRATFSSVITGVVYGGLIGVGFAFTENVVYYGQIFQFIQTTSADGAAALDAVQELFKWRGVAAPFVHPMFTMMTGLGLGIAVRHRHVGVRVLAPVAGFLTAVLLHMSYNTMASFASGAALLGLYLGLLLPTLAGLTWVVFAVCRRERRTLTARLRDYTAYGWLKPDSVDHVTSVRGRRAARRFVRRLGRAERDRLRAFQRVGIEVAVVRDRLVRGVAGKRDLQREAQLIAELRDLSRRVVLPGQEALSAADEAPARSSW